MIIDNKNNKNTYNEIDWSLVEEKWRQRWEKQKIFQAEPDLAKKKYFITVAYPYPNSPQHLGHGRTYTLADVHARYMRMKGYNVLFPMGFHYTGTPILGMSRRIAAGDKEIIDTFRKVYHLPEDVISSFIEPIKIATYFHNEIKLGMKEMGYSIDWRREFTTVDKVYSKFISWQFRTLQKMGLIHQGSHPVGWCPNDQNPVSQHDTIGDIEPDFNEYTLIKFKLKKDEDNNFNNSNNNNYEEVVIIPVATLRPETIFGVTNLWIKPESEYVKIKIDSNDKERWIVTKEAARKLEFLNHKILIESTLKGTEIVGKYAEDPLRQVLIPIYPASFVEPDNGTGIVMSVPAHAPYDYQALEDLKHNELFINEFKLQGVDIKPITIIDLEDYNSDFSSSISSDVITQIPAAEIVKKFNISNQNDPQLEKATNELYSKEFYRGKMAQNTGRYAGMSVPEAKDNVKKQIIGADFADIMFELINKPIKCRCGSECVVKLLDDQWFLNYGDKKWKDLAHECVNKMDIVPQDIRQEFNYVIDWLRERACARKSGLGTKLPWDQEWIIESLSDSSIYMAYYILAKYINNDSEDLSNDSTINAAANDISDIFFDYVLLGKGNASQVATECNVSTALVEQIRNEFSYFYPLDTRHSGRDLVPNHLSFFIFNHVAIFDRKNWPKQIVVNGSVLMEGKKMSKSLGNIIPLRAAIRENSADAIRLAILISAELLQDADFYFDTVNGIRSKLQDIYDMGIEYSFKKKEMEEKNGMHSLKSKIKSEIRIGENTKKEMELEDRWLISRLQHTIENITLSMNNLRVREALHNILYLPDRDLQWYKKRINAKGRENSHAVFVTLFAFLNTRIRMLAPFAPFLSEELWEKIREADQSSSHSIIVADWPQAVEDKKDPIAEESERLAMNLISDLQNILKVSKVIPKKIIIYTSAQWKIKIYQKLLQHILLENRTNFGDIMKEILKDPETALKAKENPKLIRKMIEDILSEPIDIRNRRLNLAANDFNEIFAIGDATSLLLDSINIRHKIKNEEGLGKNTEDQLILYREDDPEKSDPTSKAKLSRPFKPAIYIMSE